MDKKIHVGLIGLGKRGVGLLSILVKMEDVIVTAVSDAYEDRRLNAVDKIVSFTGSKPYYSDNYKDILNRKDIDAVIVSTSWADHINIVIDSMKAGKYVAFEVGGASSEDECWQLVKAYGETGIA